MSLNPYEKKRGVDSTNVDIVNAVERGTAADTQAGVPLGTKGAIEIDHETILRAEELDKKAFMDDEMEILLADPASENEPTIVEVNINGDYRMGVRGSTMKLRRYHLAVLAQAKQSRVRQKKIVNPDGSIGFMEEVVLVLTYPFTVSNEPNPKRGNDWLKALLKSPA